MNNAESQIEDADRVGVHAGHGGWLFLTGGSNSVLSQYKKSGFHLKKLWRWRRILSERRRRCKALGIVYGHVVIPEKLTVCDCALHGLPIDSDRSPSSRLERWLLLSGGKQAWIDLIRPFRKAFSDTQIYHRTDTHWTFEGCEIAYKAICEHFGVQPRNDIAARRSHEKIIFAGDLGSKFRIARDELIRSAEFATSAQRVYANEELRNLESKGRGIEAHTGSHVVYRNESKSADQRVVVLFGDSYSQHTPSPFTGTLTAMISDTFREVHMVWSANVDWNYVEKIRPEFLLTEIAERFIVVVPSN